MAVGGRDLAGARAASSEDVVCVFAHPVVGAEEPELVFDDDSRRGRRRSPRLVKPCAVPPVETTVFGVGLQRVVVVVAEDVAVELVAARLRDHVDDAAGRAAVLGLVAAGLDVDLLDELEVELLALEAVLGAGRVDAVDVERVLGAGRAVDGDGRAVDAGDTIRRPTSR